LIAAVLTVASFDTAAAQTSANPSTPATVALTPVSTAAQNAGTTDSYRWLATGFVGGGFNSSHSESSIGYGGQLAFRWRGAFGGELLAEWAPGFDFDNAFLVNDQQVNSYMANVIAALPLGGDSGFQPYMSTGIGRIQLKTEVVEPATIELFDGSLGDVGRQNSDRFGWNFGGGVMAFAGNWGFRGDVRYYRASSDSQSPAVTADLDDPPLSAGDLLVRSELSGLEFWRANIGLALRW
jgi:hypothetical protein